MSTACQHIRCSCPCPLEEVLLLSTGKTMTMHCGMCRHRLRPTRLAKREYRKLREEAMPVKKRRRRARRQR